MATLNEVKEQMIVVGSVGEFTNALQQIATLHMMTLRDQVLASRAFVEAAHQMLSELVAERNQLYAEAIKAPKKKKGDPEPVAVSDTPATGRRAVIVITSNQGLTGRYNIEIYQKLEKLIETENGSDFFVIGKKGQEAFANGKYKVSYFPYEVPDKFGISDLQRLITLFDYYDHITLVYSRYINSATREVVTLSVVAPVPEIAASSEPEAKDAAPDDKKKKRDKGNQPLKYIFEPDIETLIGSASKTLRGALFQQQIMDARLAQYSAQMIGMKTASDNATILLGDLRVEYNKQRRKMIDKKIGEVFAGSALW